MLQVNSLIKTYGIVGLTFSSLIFSQTLIAANDFPNTLTYKENVGSPKAKITDISWLQGYWQGEIWDGHAEEIWSNPLAGSMMASFKFATAEAVKFYEIITLFEQDESLVLRLKHFSSALQGWEDKDQYMEFKLVKLTENIAYFDKYTYQLVSPNELHVFVVIEDKGIKQETKFVFRRKDTQWQ
jgi:hypothetical protein